MQQQFKIDLLNFLFSARMMQMLSELTGAQQNYGRQESWDYMSAEEQERIAEEIRWVYYVCFWFIKYLLLYLKTFRLQNVQQNMESAIEHMPEAFGHIVMLYINCYVNGHHVKAFVDSGYFLVFFFNLINKNTNFILLCKNSGAQMTIMSAACAERCGIMRLVDKRWAGIIRNLLLSHLF